MTWRDRFSRGLRRAARLLLGTLIIGVLALSTTIAVALFAVDTSWGRNQLREFVNESLEASFRGKVHIKSIADLDFGGVDGIHGSVTDPEGNTVLEVSGLSVGLNVFALIGEVLGDPEVDIRLDKVEVQHARVHLIDNGEGIPSLAQAFEAKTPSAPAQGSTQFHIESIALAHVWAHGKLSNVPIDSEVYALTGSLDVMPELLTITVDETKLEARALPYQLAPRGKLQGKLDLALAPETSKLVAKAKFEGRLRRTWVVAQLKLDGDQLSAKLSAPSVAPEVVQGLVPQSQLTKPINLQLQAHGTLQRPELKLNATLGDASLEVTGHVDLETNTAEAKLQVKALDLSEVQATAPRSSINLRANASASQLNSEPALHYAVNVSPSQLAGEQLPETNITGTLKLATNGTLTARGTAKLREPGAPTTVSYSVTSDAKGALSVQSTASTNLNQARRLQRLAGLEAQGTIKVSAHYQQATGKLSGTLTAELTKLTDAAWTARGTVLKGTLEGSLENPELALDASVDELSLKGKTFHDLTASARGTPSRLALQADVRKPLRATAEATLTLKPQFQVIDPQVVVEGEQQQTLTLASDGLRVDEEEGIVIDNIVVSTPGAGKATLSLVFRDSLRSFSFEADKLDVRRAVKLLDFEDSLPLPGGQLSGSGHYSQAGRAAKGFLNITWNELQYGPLNDATAKMNMKLEADGITGDATLLWASSKVAIELRDVPLPERAPAKPSDLHGYAGLELSVKLSDVEPFLHFAKVPIDAARGDLTATLALENTREVPGRISVNMDVEGLELVGQRGASDNNATNSEAKAAAPWSLSRFGLSIVATADAAKRELSWYANVSDATGALAVSQATVELPSNAMQRSMDSWSGAWKQADTQARVWILPRQLSEWPAIARIPDVRGIPSLSLQFTGSYASPSLRLMGRVRDLGSDQGSQQALSVDFSGHYSKSSGTLRAQVLHQAEPVAALHSQWQGDPVAYLTGGGQLPEIELQASMVRLPVAAIPRVANQGFQGHLSGQLLLERLQPLTGRLQLSSDDLGFEDLRAERTVAEADIAGQNIDVKLLMTGRELGELSASVKGTAEAVAQSNFEELRARLDARAFQLKTLRPLLAGSVNGLEGRLDANVSGRLSTVDPDLRGTLRIADASLQLPALGQRLSAINAKVQVQPGRVELSQLEASGTTGRLTAQGSARLNGVSLSSARVKLAISEDEKLPLTTQGVALGDVWGRAQVSYSAINERRQRLDVDLEHFEIELPRVTPHGVQSLDPARHVDVGFVRGDGKFVEIPLQPIERETSGRGSRWLIAVNLGSIVVHKGPGIEIKLGGKLKARIGRRTTLDGKIEVEGGTLDVSGKEFTIESGSITFDRSEPEQGIVVARARWESPLEYTVYAEYSGTVEEGELSLRSEPPLTEDEILSLLMFGTPGGSFGSGEKSEAATAIGVAGGTVTQGLNRALADISQLDVSTRIDTSAGEARPELVVQLSPRLTGRVTQAIGEPAPGQSPDRTFFTVELRLFRRWALSTEVGDEGGTSLDLIWRHQF